MRKTYRLSRIGILPTAKLACMVYFAIGSVAAVFIFVSALFAANGQNRLGEAIFALLAPFLYGAAGFMGTAIACWLYNVAANWVGGIEGSSRRSVA